MYMCSLWLWALLLVQEEKNVKIANGYGITNLVSFQNSMWG